MACKILVLNGPGLADLSDYEAEVRQGLTLDKVRDECKRLCAELGVELDFRQTEDQDELYRWIAKDSESADAIVINPVGASRTTTIAPSAYGSARHLVARLKKPVIEVHIENIYAHDAEVTQPEQEPHGNTGFVCGLGVNGYLLAIKAIARKFVAAAVR